MYYVYVLKSKDHNQIYIGSTIDLKSRLKEHNNGKVFSTKKYMPWKLVYYEASENEKLARLREKKLKHHGNAKRELLKRIGCSSCKSGAGFTLIELMVYIAIISIILVASINFMWQIMNTRTKSQVTQEAQQNARFAMERMVIEIRGAEDVVKTGGASTFDVHPGKLTLQYTAGDVVIDTATSTVTLGGKSVDIRKLRITEGAGSPIELTSDRVDVTNLIFTDLTQGDDKDNIRIQLTIENVNPENVVWRESSISLQSAASIRQ